MMKKIRFIKYYIFIFFFYNFNFISAQNADTIPITLYKGNKTIDVFFPIIFKGEDTLFIQECGYLSVNDLKMYSVGICYGKHRLFIPRREENVWYIHIYLNKYTYRKKLGESGFAIGKIFRKYYYVDLGLDVVFKIPKTKKKFCEINE